jgi:N-acetylmuramoyl-L-alanine amidase
LRTVDGLLGVTQQESKSVASIILRTSRLTTPSKEPHGPQDRWKLDIVVLDAGHGGKDPGAQGLGGTNEADVTLGIVLKLGRILQKAGFTVVYTRKTDEFIELYRRAQIANEAKGKLFISVHCNSMPTKPNPANGFESYILRPGKNESAVRVAERENGVIGLEHDKSRYGGTTEESFIVAAMAQSGFVRYSERFANLLQEELARHMPGSKNNGVSQAGFLVLVGASMPNILIESGYISNTREEKMLASGSGQQHIAEGIAAAVKRYRVSYERNIAK